MQPEYRELTVKEQREPRQPADYETGYGKPPKARQWRPGQSGNPNGRPKGSRNKPTLEDFLRAEGDKLLFQTQKKLFDECGLSQYGIKPRPRRSGRK